jgi:transposase
MGKQVKYSPEVRERAVRMFQEHVHEHPSRWAAMRSIASKIGCTTQSVIASNKESRESQRGACGYSTTPTHDVVDSWSRNVQRLG